MPRLPNEKGMSDYYDKMTAGSYSFKKKGDLPLGTVVVRRSQGCLGDGSVGYIDGYSSVGNTYHIHIIEGKGGMEKWKKDYWAKEWCKPVNFNADWEV